MDLTIGIETRDEYLSLEVAKGAMTMVRDVLLAKPGETVLITGDTSSDKRVIDAFAQAAYAIDMICGSSCHQYASHVIMCSYGSAGTGSGSGRESRCMD